MTDGPTESRWPRLLSLAVHELRTPQTVVAGYIRMLLRESAGPISDQQRRMLEEAEKSVARVSALLAEMSDLAKLEAGSAPFNRSAVDLGTLLEETIASLPPLLDREVTITLQNQVGVATVEGDPVRLKAAVASLLAALRRELVSATELVVRLRRGTADAGPVFWMSVADPTKLEAVDGGQPSELGAFDEWRGGCGLSLPLARQVLTAHGGCLWSPRHDPRAGAIAMLPERR
ncbi:MAG TPA: HAMP domain-containing sensor histidine kinase [Longimicrobiales bacterium]|nr:HAMP domain-containing sensor histidine kinase [Longimicrobiales bacterium]